MVTSEVLAAFAGTLLSLAFSYIPNLKTWFGAKDDETQRGIMLILVLLAALIAFGLSCANVQGLPFTIACTQTGFIGLAQTVFAAAVANQVTHRLSPNSGTPAPAG